MAEASIDILIGKESRHTFTTTQLGVHTVQVLYTSQHFPNEQAMPVMVTVEGERIRNSCMLNGPYAKLFIQNQGPMFKTCQCAPYIVIMTISEFKPQG